MVTTRTTTAVTAALLLAGFFAVGAGLPGSGDPVAQPQPSVSRGVDLPTQGPVGPHCWGPSGWNSACGPEPLWGPGMGPGYYNGNPWGPGMMGPGSGGHGPWGQDWTGSMFGG